MVNVLVLPEAAHRAVGHARGDMAGLSQAIVLILTAKHALARAVAMSVLAAAAER